jgi:predicted phage gp36 major capsid-like protein
VKGTGGSFRRLSRFYWLARPRVTIEAFDSYSLLVNYAVVGDFSRFAIVHRSGLDVELVTGIPNFAGGSNMPMGEIGVWGMSRFGSDAVEVNVFRVLA